VVVYSDHQGFLWFIGKNRLADKRKTELGHKLALWGFLLICVSGFLLFFPMKDFLLKDTVFIVKMVFVVAVGINGLFIGKLSQIAINKSFVEISKKEKTVLFLSGAISTISWISAGVLAFFIF
jgi:flagellar motor component MotA